MNLHRGVGICPDGAKSLISLTIYETLYVANKNIAKFILSCPTSVNYKGLRETLGLNQGEIQPHTAYAA